MIRSSCCANFNSTMPERAERCLTTGTSVGNGGQCGTAFLVKVVTQATKNMQLTGSIDPFSVRIPVSPPDIRPLRSRVLLRLHHRHVAQVTVKLIVVETEADDEAVGNLETAELHGDLDEPAGIAVQESAHGQRVGAAAGERLQKVAQRQSGIHDILHQQHIFVFDAIVQILGDAAPDGVRTTTRLAETRAVTSSSSHCRRKRELTSSGPGATRAVRSPPSPGTAYTRVLPLRTLTAPSSRRSRDSVAWERPTPPGERIPSTQPWN